MPFSKKNVVINLDEIITVEDELVDDFEKINFGAKAPEVLEKKLHEGLEAIWEEEEKKSRIQGKSKKIVKNKMKLSKEKTIERVSCDLEKTLPQKNIYHHAPTLRNK